VFSGCGQAAWCNRDEIVTALQAMPSLSLRVEVNGRGYSYAGPGVVTSDIDSQGILNTTIRGAHLLNPGVVARTAEFRDGQ
jgi:predicted ribosome-associated RNA-binding protein Tma20